MQADCPVLIIGAGPTGLTMATILHYYGIPFHIIDKKPERTQTSNALGLHARTLELLEDLNLIGAFLDRGKPITQAMIYSHHKIFAKLNMDTINSAYPYILIVPQSHTEQILEDNLAKNGIAVERNAELIDIKKLPQGYQAILQKKGETKSMTARYLIAADGSHSTVRKLCDLDFTGREIPQQFMLADALLQTSLDMNHLQIFYEKEGLLALFPLPNGEVRLVCDVPQHQKIPHEAHAIEQAIKMMAEQRSQQQLRVENCSWASTFWIHSKYIKNMHYENIFFMGDAAHIHSPAGGQGMNTGMQDAYNLGWKLALCLKNQAPSTLLTSFQEERHPVIRQVVNETDKMTRLLLASNPFTQFARQYILRPLLNISKINQKLATHMAMLDIHYTKSSIIHYRSTISNRSPQPGELIPEISSFHPKHFTSFLKSKKHILLIFSGKKIEDSIIGRIKKITTLIQQDYKEIVDLCLISPTPLKMAMTQLDDPELQIHTLFNVEQAALVLVRPDKYIAFCSAFLDIKALLHYLTSIYKQH